MYKEHASMKFKKILMIGIGESRLDPEYWKRIDTLAEKIVKLPKDSSEIKKQLADTDCLLVGFGIPVNQEHLNSASHLKYIGTFSIAYGNVDIVYAKKKSIPVCNLDGNTTKEAVAEFVFAAILEYLRDLERGKKQAREGNYSEAGFSATEIKGKVFGILGLGKIGGTLSEIALAFHADVRYWSRHRKKELESKGIKYESADSLIPKCDFISLNFALNEDTKNFLNKKRIMKIKKGAVVINTSPMELVDINALNERLQREDMTFILDHSDEMTEEDLRKLSRHKNCIIYPPIAYVTKETRKGQQESFIGNIENFLKGLPTNIVNP